MGVMDSLLQIESARVVSLTNGSHSEGRLGILSMENDHDASNGGLPKYKRRKVSAVRDFPPGCGRSTSQINKMLNGEVVIGIIQPGAENVVISSNHADMSDLVSSGPNGLMPSGSENLNTSGVNIPDVSKTLNTPHTGNSDKEMVQQNSSRARSSHDSQKAVPNSNIVGKVLIRNYPPRRRVSAIRDFPPFCGRDAPALSKEESADALPSSASSVQEKSGYEVKPLMTSKNKTGDDGYDGVALTSEFRGDVSGITSGKVVPEFEGHATMEMKNHDNSETTTKNLMISSGKFVPEVEGPATMEMKNHDDSKTTSSNMMTVPQEDTRVVYPQETKRYRFDGKTGALLKSSNRDVGVLEENLVRDIVVYGEHKRLDSSRSDFSTINKHFEDESSEDSLLALDLVIVQGLMASSNCPWRVEKGACKPHSVGRGGQRKRKMYSMLPLSKSASKAIIKAESSEGSISTRISFPEKNAFENSGALVLYSQGNDGERENYHLGRSSRVFNVTVPPSRPSMSSGYGVDNDAICARSKVRETLRLFQALCRKLLHEEEAKPTGPSSHKRVDYLAARILRDKGVLKEKGLKDKGQKIIGSVPGVEVGDEFQYRVELNMIGLHLQIQGGIDYVKYKGKVIATSIVASGGYDDNLENSDVLIYTGQGGNVISGGKEPEDQKLERGNLALVNSVHEENPVRVIRGETKTSDSRIYIYDGLYLVERYWQDVGSHGKLVFKFKLTRIPGQPELSWKVVKRCKKSKVREGLCVDDISQGKELIPICAVNTIDDENPPTFKYVTKIIYPDWCHPILPKGCDCTNGCSELRKCACVAKNGGEIPYNHNGAIVEVKSLVYECGPSCKCPSSCYNRVSQHGIKFQLEIFKTEARGWGVRSLNSIPSGSFICEYIGELLEDKEAERRTGSDEYLFDIGNNFNDSSLWSGLSTVMPDPSSSSCGGVEDGRFTIDAAEYGNVGRFVNHSCSPNLYAQNVLYDHEDKRMPHIMLFAAENIPPLQELTYHYNYVVDQVFDSSGNIKKKSCFCGSSECTGRLY